MKITIFAATGGIGRLAVEQAVAAGHEVTAVARRPSGFPAGVHAVTADLGSPDPALLAAAVKGADAVLSGLGPRPLAEVGIASRGTAAILAAMQAAGVRRLIVVSAAPIGTVPSPRNPRPPRYDPGDGFFMRHLLGPLIKAILRKPYADLAVMEDLVRDSGLDWTLARPPRLTNGPRTGKYRTALGQNLRGGTSISRADVADFLLAAPSRPETVHQVVGLAD